MDTECQKTSVDSEAMDVDCSTCQHADVYVPNPNPKTSTPVKSQQVVIVPSQEVPVSSDESINIDAGTEMTTLVEKQLPIKSLNPWGDKGVHEISIEIVENLNDSEESTELHGFEKAPPVYFNPLTDDDRIVAALSFNLKLHASAHTVKFIGAGKKCKSPPEIYVKSVGNGVCVFNSISMLLTG